MEKNIDMKTRKRTEEEFCPTPVSGGSAVRISDMLQAGHGTAGEDGHCRIRSYTVDDIYWEWVIVEAADGAAGAGASPQAAWNALREQEPGEEKLKPCA